MHKGHQGSCFWIGLILCFGLGVPSAYSKGKSWETFKKPPREVLFRMLTPLQMHVTQDKGVEPRFKNEFWNNRRPGIYVDLVSGEPLFSTSDQFDAKSGWPSFTKPLIPANLVTKPNDQFIFQKRTEVRSKHGDSHLGFLFTDGPAPSNNRYSINSAALRFIPVEKLREQGYEEFSSLFRRK